MSLVNSLKCSIYSLFGRITNILAGKGLGKIPGLLRLHTLLARSLRHIGIVKVKTEAGLLFMDTKDTGMVPYLLDYGVYEDFETQLFKSKVKPGMVVVDIGANIGYYSIIGARLVGDNGLVYAFEPEPNNYALLLQNILLNKCQNIIPVRKALSDKHGFVRLYVDNTNLGSHSMASGNIENQIRSEEVEAETMDHYFENTDKTKINIDVVKIDTQGAEGLVLRGSEMILRDTNPIIFMEFWPRGLRNMGTDPEAFIGDLKSYGFKVWKIDSEKKCIVEAEPRSLVETCDKARGDKDFVNLLLEK